MKLHTINTGLFKLDGGAMYGVVPKSIWNKLNPADANNMCTWALRCLLIEDGDRLILIDTGIGSKQDKRFFDFFYLHGEDTLEKSIQSSGYSIDEVTDVILTHLHFDHCGGAVGKNFDNAFSIPFFKNATYWSNSFHWDWAINPNQREKASFLKENILPLKASGQLKFIEQNSSPFQNIEFVFVDGHTEKQMLPIVSYKNEKIAFVADLIPSVGHIPLPYIMSYDVRPLQTLVEKETFLNLALEKKYKLFLEHDPLNECCSLIQTERGIRLDQTFSLIDLL